MSHNYSGAPRLMRTPACVAREHRVLIFSAVIATLIAIAIALLWLIDVNNSHKSSVTARVLNPHYLAISREGDALVLFGSDGVIDMLPSDMAAANIAYQGVEGHVAAYFAVAQNPFDQSSVAVGEQGQIAARRAKDSSWRAIESPVQDNLRRIAVDASTHLWYAVSDANALISGRITDAAWQRLDVGVGAVADVVWSPVHQAIISVGALGWIASKQKNSDEWKKIESPTTQNFTRVFAFESHLFLLTDANQLWSISTHSQDWVQWPVPPMGQITDLLFDKNSQKLTLVTAAGEIVSAKENADTFISEVVTDDYLTRVIQLPAKNSLSSDVRVSAAMVAIGNTGQLWFNAGESIAWERITTNTEINFNIASPFRDGVIVAGEGGAIVYFDTVSRTLEVVKSPISAFIHDLDYAAGRPQTLIGARGLLLESDEGWRTWSAPDAQLDGGDYLFSLINLPNGVQLAAGPPGTILRRGKDEDDWRIVLAVNDINRAYFHGLVASLEGVAVAIAGPGDNYVSRDSGQSWRELSRSETRHRYTALYSNAWSRFVAVGQAGLISFSNDGDAWQTLENLSDENFQALAEVALVDDPAAPTRLLIATQTGKIFWSDTGAETWEMATRESTGSVLHIKSVDEGRVLLASGVAGSLLRSRDRGLTWQKVVSHASGNLREPLEDRARKIIYIPSRTGEIIASRDQGATWELLATVTRSSIKGLLIDEERDQLIAFGERLTVLPRL